MSERKDYWFPAKRFGWGWGLPCAWQGWVVLAAAVLLLAGGLSILRPLWRPLGREGDWFIAGYEFLVVAALLFVTWRKGEPPRWRWGR